MATAFSPGPRKFVVTVCLASDNRSAVSAAVTIDADDIYQDFGAVIRAIARESELKAGLRASADLA